MKTATKKITLATVKAFIRKNADNLYVSTLSDFDGMVDCITDCADKGFHKAELTNIHCKNTLGIHGCWFVGGSRNYFCKFENEQFAGIEVSNCCGRFILATTKS
jgi:hypothetical protein